MREKIEARIKEILGYVGLESTLSAEVLELFDDAEIKQILHFLELGDFVAFGAFVQETVANFESEKHKTAFLKNKVIVEKEKQVEQLEGEQEQRELEHIFDEL